MQVIERQLARVYPYILEQDRASSIPKLLGVSISSIRNLTLRVWLLQSGALCTLVSMDER